MLQIKKAAIAVIILVLLCGCQPKDNTGRLLDEITSYTFEGYSELYETKNEEGYIPQQDTGEFRGVWITYSELAVKDPAFTEEQYVEKIAAMMDNLKAMGINAVFIHVRAFGDAFYNSSIFPWSAYLSGTQGVAPLYDPLQIAIEQAHAREIAVHAWLNPYRISTSTEVTALSENNPARGWLEAGDNTNVLTLSNGLYYNPASTEAQNLIIRGIREILENYDVQGIHFDDYFYPSNEEGFDSADYNTYLEKGGQLDLTLWRRANVTALIVGTYNAVKEIKPDAVFGVSVSADITRNMNSLYADVKTWGSEPGYVDYICPQIYFGFDHTILPFEKTFQDWESIILADDVAMYTGLAVYKAGNEDVNAGAEQEDQATPRYEWMNCSDIIKRQIEVCRKSKKNSGFAFFSYSYLCNSEPTEILQKEIEGIKSQLS